MFSHKYLKKLRKKLFLREITYRGSIFPLGPKVFMNRRPALKTVE